MHHDALPIPSCRGHRRTVSPIQATWLISALLDRVVRKRQKCVDLGLQVGNDDQDNAS
jgi:hypothetical protein